MNTSRGQQYSSLSTMLKTIGIAIISTCILGLAFRVGYHAERAAVPTQEAAH